MDDHQSRDTSQGAADEDATAASGEERDETDSSGSEHERHDDHGDHQHEEDEQEHDHSHHNHEEDDHHEHEDADHQHDHDHDHHQHDVAELGVGVLTVSSSRSLDDDPAGDAIVELLEDEGHEVVTRELVPDDYDGVQGTMNNIVTRDDVNVAITSGGTGVTPDDVTVEAVEPLLDKELPGFGELFRRLSYEDIGTKVVATRATAGVVDGAVVFCLPGSEAAARLGTGEIIVEEAGHLAGLAARDGESDGE